MPDTCKNNKYFEYHGFNCYVVKPNKDDTGLLPIDLSLKGNLLTASVWIGCEAKSIPHMNAGQRLVKKHNLARCMYRDVDVA